MLVPSSFVLIIRYVPPAQKPKIAPTELIMVYLTPGFPIRCISALFKTQVQRLELVLNNGKKPKGNCFILVDLEKVFCQIR